MSKGVSNVIWFLLAFIVIVILFGIGILILSSGKDFAVGNLDKLVGEINKALGGS